MGGPDDADGSRSPAPGGGPEGSRSCAALEGEVRRHHLIVLVDALPDLAAGAGTAPGPDPRGLRARLGRLCALAVTEVGVSGAGVTVMGSVDSGVAGHRDQVWATGAVSRRLEDLQLTAGEGPCLEAYTDGAPALAGDLAADPARWLGFGTEAIAAGAAAVFSLPLQIGAVRLGTLDLYRATAGALTRAQLADALMLASLATETLLELVGDPDPDDPDAVDHAGTGTAGLLSESVGWLPDVHAEVHQASGMISAREGIGVGEALLRLRGYSFAQDVPIGEVARRVIDRTLTLRDHDDGHDLDGGPAGPEAETER